MRAFMVLLLILASPLSWAEVRGCEVEMTTPRWRAFVQAIGLNFVATHPATMPRAQWEYWRRAEVERLMPLGAGAQTELVATMTAPAFQGGLVADEPPRTLRAMEFKLAPTAGAETTRLLREFKKLGVRHFAFGYAYTTRPVSFAIDDRTEIGDYSELHDVAALFDWRTCPNCFETVFLPAAALASNEDLQIYLSGLLALIAEDNAERVKSFQPSARRLLGRIFRNFATRAYPFQNSGLDGRAHDSRVIELRPGNETEEAATVIHEETHSTTMRKVALEQNPVTVGRALYFKARAPLKNVLAAYQNGFRFDEVEAFFKESAYAETQTDRAGAWLALTYSGRMRVTESLLLLEALAQLRMGLTSIVTEASVLPGLEHARLIFQSGDLQILLPRGGLVGPIEDYVAMILRARLALLETDATRLRPRFDRLESAVIR